MPLPLLAVEDPTLQFNFDKIAALLNGPGIPRIVSGGKKNIATSESTTSTTYTTLTTPDTVTVALPTDGLIAVWYQAIWQNTVANNARASVFIGANQLKAAIGTGAPSAAIPEATGPAEVNDDAVLGSYPTGLTAIGGVGATTEVTTGQVVGGQPGNNLGGPCWVFAAAGTYAVSIQFKNNAAGTLTASKRHLWVAAYAFA